MSEKKKYTGKKFTQTRVISFLVSNPDQVLTTEDNRYDFRYSTENDRFELSNKGTKAFSEVSVNSIGDYKFLNPDFDGNESMDDVIADFSSDQRDRLKRLVTCLRQEIKAAVDAAKAEILAAKEAKADDEIPEGKTPKKVKATNGATSAGGVAPEVAVAQ